MRMKVLLAKTFGSDCIVYSDTDSIVMSFDKYDPATNALIQMHYLNYTKKTQEGLDTSKEIEVMNRLLTKNECIQKLLELECKDLTCLHENRMVKMIHPTNLG